MNIFSFSELLEAIDDDPESGTGEMVTVNLEIIACIYYCESFDF